MALVPESLIMPVADALQIPLHPDQGKYKGRQARIIKVGHWKISADVRLVSDELNERVATFIVHLRKDLWLYVLCSDNGNTLVAHVVNGALCGLSRANLESYGLGDRGKTMDKMKKGMSVMYRYSRSKEQWE